MTERKPHSSSNRNDGNGTGATASRFVIGGWGDPRGQRIGPYALLNVLGEGGFGVVFLAERRDPHIQRVAIKVIKPGMDTRAVLARFEQERQALAVMDHPNVAKVYDAGTTVEGDFGGSGRPYFVMEHVQGEPITDFCDRSRMTIAQRLELFIAVCEAVQHAHHKGIIHRDITPRNVLVMVKDGHAIPKVIDFGMARAISHALTDKTIYTQPGQPIGTPAYMSPEQAEMGATDIDTRTDVYSLGVLLYEILTGLLPFEWKDLQSDRAHGYETMKRVIREVDPPTPSARLTGADDASGVRIAASRRGERAALSKELRRELDWIPLKAMRKDRRERYGSPADLARDVRNYLEGKPLEAGPESATYRLRKFVRRRRGPVMAGTALLVTLGAGLAGTGWGMYRAETQRTRAEEARERKGRILDFVTESLKSSDPSEGGEQGITILQAMENALQDIESGRFNDDPETDAGLRETIATILINNGRAADAERLYVQALEMRRRLFKADHADVASSLDKLALVQHKLGRMVEAEPLCVQALEMRRRLFTGDHQDVATSLNNLALVRQHSGRVAEAEQLYVEALEMSQRLFPGDNLDKATSLENLAGVLWALGRADEAEKLHAQAMEMFERLFPDANPKKALALSNHAYERQLNGRLNASSETNTLTWLGARVISRSCGSHWAARMRPETVSTPLSRCHDASSQTARPPLLAPYGVPVRSTLKPMARPQPFPNLRKLSRLRRDSCPRRTFSSRNTETRSPHAAQP